MINYKSKAALAYSILREKIISGEFQFGQLLSTNSLSEQLGISRTPMLEAFKMLESEGIVTVIPQVGVLVRPFNDDVSTMRAKFTMQALLEGYLAAETTKKMNPELEVKIIKLLNLMESCIIENNSKSYSELNQDFHELLISSAEHAYLRNAFLQLYNKNVYFNLVPVLFDENMKTSLNEHKGIVDAMISRDERKVRELMEQHTLRVREDYIQKLMNIT